MIKNIDLYKKIEKFMRDKEIDSRKYLNISEIKRTFDIPYSTAYKYGNEIMDRIERERK